MQHLGLFVPWNEFLLESARDINCIWESKKKTLSPRLLNVVENIQLLRESAEDAKRDAMQWAAQSGEADPTESMVDTGLGEVDERAGTKHRADEVGNMNRLIDVLRNAVGSHQVTTGSKDILCILRQLHRFSLQSRASEVELCSSIIVERENRIVREEGRIFSGAELPDQRRIRAIKLQQNSVSKEQESQIRGMQSQADNEANENRTAYDAALWNVQSGFGDEDIVVTEGGLEETMALAGPSVSVQFGPSVSWCTAGKELAEQLSLNKKQSIALRLICRQLDRVGRNEQETPQLCQYLGGEGGTGKSRVIKAVATLFERKGMSHRLLITGTSGAAAATVNGITIHSACNIPIDSSRVGPDKRAEGVASSSALRIDGESRASWREKYMLIIDEVSMLGARTLHAINESLCALRGRKQDFGGIPIVLFCGDFRQFRPVQERPIILPSAAFPWDEEKRFTFDQRHKHDKAHSLWKKFTTIIILTEQMRAAGDPELQRLLTRIRQGVQDQSDVDLLNSRCYQKGRSIPWDSGITVVTPLNRNRWCLNMEATSAFQKRKGGPLHVFISEHKWKGEPPSEEEATMMLNQGDESRIPIPAVFMFVPGMPVVVTQNTYQGLKLVNGASYDAVDVVIDKAFPGHQISADTILYFGPPAGILLASDTTKHFHFVGMPPGTILLTPTSVKIDCQRKRPWQETEVSRRGLPCTAAFACTDYKVQGKTLDRVGIELRGTRTQKIDGISVPGQCDPYGLYVQLSRSRTLNGIMLLSEARARDIIGNVVPASMIEAGKEHERLSETTISEAESWDWEEECT